MTPRYADSSMRMSLQAPGRDLLAAICLRIVIIILLYTKIVINFPVSPGIVYSEKYNIQVSENGMHQGVLYNGYVYCNVHPYGLPEQEWINDFVAFGMKTVTYFPF